MGFNDANELLAGGGDPTIKFANLGDSVEGLLLDAEVVDQTTPQGDTVYDKKTGKVKKQIIYTLQTDLRDPAIEDDDGKRRVFAKWAIQQAITDALREAGLERVGLQANGRIKITHNATKKSDTRGFSDMKLFEAQYTPPALASSTEPAPSSAPAAADEDVDLVATYGQQAVDMAFQIYNTSPDTPMAIISQATKIPEAHLRPALTGEIGPF